MAVSQEEGLNGQTALEALGAVQGTTEAVYHLLERLEAHLEARNEPARWITVDLTQATPVKTDNDMADDTRSLGILNPTSIPIYIGIGGGRASASARAPSAPPRSLLVLPLAATDVELGVDPADQAALAAGAAVVFLLRFKAVQPPYMQAL